MFTRRQVHRLDAIRGFASLYVAFTHSHAVFHTPLKFLGGFGAEGVALFFLLSGSVIGGSLLRQINPNWRTYFFHRFRRIWPPFIVALFLTWLVQCLLQSTLAPIHGAELFGNLTMLQDLIRPGYLFNAYYNNWPLWSLAYEWWYYMLIPLCWFFPPAQRANIVLVISCIAALIYRVIPFGPLAYLGYWYLWWAGVEVAREVHKHQTATWSGQRANMLRLITLCACWTPGVFIAIIHHHPLSPANDPFLPLRHCAAGLVLLSISLFWSSKNWKGFNYSLGFFSKFAPISFSIYLFHYPIFQLAEAIFPSVHEAILFTPSMSATLLLAWLVERKMQPIVIQIMNRLTKQTTTQHAS